MQYLPDNDLQGTGAYLGEVRVGQDGQLYQLGQVADQYGNVSGAWFPTSLSMLEPMLQSVLAPLQQMLPGLGQNPVEQPQLGEVRQGADGQLYQYVQTVDGLGNLGFAWASLIPLAAQLLPTIGDFIGGMFNKNKGSQPAAAANPDWSQLIPQIAKAVAGAINKPAGVNGLDTWDDPLMGDYELDGLEADDDLDGLGADDDLDGLGDGGPDLGLNGQYLGSDGGLYEFSGLDDIPDELDGLDLGDDELPGVSGYTDQPVRSTGYVPEAPAASPRFANRQEAPDMWKPVWA